MDRIARRLNQWDHALFLLMFSDAPKRWVRSLMVGATVAGNGPVYLFLGLAALLWDRDTGRSFFISAAAAFALELSAYKILKKVFKRSRPYETLDGVRFHFRPPDEFSFPSGHTAAAFVMACLLSYYYPSSAYASFLFAISVGYSRVYLGVHYPGDVLAGSVLGILCAGASLLL